MKSGKNILLVTACALLDGQGRVLLAQRPPGRTLAGLWEFPGGKLEAGETPEGALVRELREELGVGVSPGDLRPWAFASHAYEAFHLLMPLYLCRRWQGAPAPMEGQKIIWAKTDELAGLPMPPADGPLLERLREVLK